jgi:Peptidase_C39 like family
VIKAAALGAAVVTALVLVGGSTASSAASPTQVVPLGTEFKGECVLEGGRIDGRLASWEISGVIPAFLHGGKGGVRLALPAKDLPRFANQKGDEPFKNEWVLVPWLTASHSDQNCKVRSFDPLQAVTLEVPGPHVFVQYDQRVSFVAVPSEDAPIPQPCARNDPDFPDPSSEIPPPPDTGDERLWVVKSFCNTTKLVGLHVRSTGTCPRKGDMSGWPGMPYINQYDAGARLGLPTSSANRRGVPGPKGGNACGPSSLLMAMLEVAGPSGLPSLPELYDATMQHPASVPGDNLFAGSAKAVPYLRGLGWNQARTVDLGRDVEGMEKKILTSLAKGPVVISTAFGTSEWGVSGGGHMIMIFGADKRGNFIVDDPAGNYFATEKGGYSHSGGGHYGQGSCGHRVLYPHFWLLAYTTGRWLLELGPPPARTRTPTSVDRNIAAVRASVDTSALSRSQASPQPAPIMTISDAHPGAADAPSSFHLQDSTGRRAGWIDGNSVEGIPGVTVAQDAPGWTDPAAGDPDLDDDPREAPPTPRVLVARYPGAGTTLRVTARAGARFALTLEIWGDGKVVARHTLTGTGTGSPEIVSLPAPPPAEAPAKPGKSSKVVASLVAGTPRVDARAVTVPLTCSAQVRAPCRYTAVLTARVGGRTVTVASSKGAIPPGKTVAVVAGPGAALLRSLSNFPLSLVVKYQQAARPAAVVLRREVRIR